jgi:hypothetical protein
VTLPLRTLAPCLWCGTVVCIRRYRHAPDAHPRAVWEEQKRWRYLWQHWLSPVVGDEHHCVNRKDPYVPTTAHQ